MPRVYEDHVTRTQFHPRSTSRLLELGDRDRVGGASCGTPRAPATSSNTPRAKIGGTSVTSLTRTPLSPTCSTPLKPPNPWQSTPAVTWQRASRCVPMCMLVVTFSNTTPKLSWSTAPASPPVGVHCSTPLGEGTSPRRNPVGPGGGACPGSALCRGRTPGPSRQAPRRRAPVRVGRAGAGGGAGQAVLHVKNAPQSGPGRRRLFAGEYARLVHGTGPWPSRPRGRSPLLSCSTLARSASEGQWVLHAAVRRR